MKPMYCNPSAFVLAESSPLLLRLKSSIIFSTKKERKKEEALLSWYGTPADMDLLLALSIPHMKENCNINRDLVLIYIHLKEELHVVFLMHVHWIDVKRP